MEHPKMKLVKFSADFCGPCKAMEKAKTIERLIEKHPNVSAVNYSCANKEGDAPKGSEYAKNAARAEVYVVDAFPTLIFELESGGELVRSEGGMNLKELEELYEDAIARWEVGQGKVPEDGDEDGEEEDEG